MFVLVKVPTTYISEHSRIVVSNLFKSNFVQRHAIVRNYIVEQGSPIIFNCGPNNLTCMLTNIKYCGTFSFLYNFVGQIRSDDRLQFRHVTFVHFDIMLKFMVVHIITVAEFLCQNMLVFITL